MRFVGMTLTGLCLVLCLGLFATAVFAEDEIPFNVDALPPPPAAPPLPALLDDGPPMPAAPPDTLPPDAMPPDTIPSEPMPPDLMGEDGPPAPEAAPAPTPVYVEIAPPPPPADGSRVLRVRGSKSGLECREGCAQRRDDCCWPIDCRGCRYGRFDITLEGLSGVFQEAPAGPFGLADIGTADQITYDGLDYGSFFDVIGGRGTFRYAVNPGEWLELRGTYYGSWDATARDTGTFAFTPGPGGVGGAIAPNATTLDAEAEVYGGEFNWVTELSCEGCTRWDFLLGARYLQFEETLSATNWTAPFPGFRALPSAASAVENTFIGLQLGGAVHRDFGPNVTFTATLKGLLGNMNRTVNVSDVSFFAGGPHAASSDDDEIVFGADLDLSILWRLTSRIGLTAGYNLLFMDNIVRAHDGMDFTKSTSGALQAQQVTDQLVVHSLFFGVNFNL